MEGDVWRGMCGGGFMQLLYGENSPLGKEKTRMTTH